MNTSFAIVSVILAFAVSSFAAPRSRDSSSSVFRRAAEFYARTEGKARSPDQGERSWQKGGVWDRPVVPIRAN